MNDDIQRSLLTKKNASFQKLYQQCQLKLRKIKQKNDYLQKQINIQVQQQMKGQVHKQKQFLQRQIKDIKEIMSQMQQRFKNPQSKNKLKTLKAQTEKQIQRNKLILKDLINKSFIRGSIDETFKNQDIKNNKYGRQVNNRKNNKDEGNSKKHSIVQQEQRQIEIDYQIEKKIINQRDLLLNQVQQTALRNNQIMNDLALMVDQQRQNLDIIHQQLSKGHQNVLIANQHMDQAQKLQRKSRKKYCFLAIIIIIIVAIIIGTVLILNS